MAHMFDEFKKEKVIFWGSGFVGYGDFGAVALLVIVLCGGAVGIGEMAHMFDELIK